MSDKKCNCGGRPTHRQDCPVRPPNATERKLAALTAERDLLQRQVEQLTAENIEHFREQMSPEGRCPVGHNKKFTFTLDGKDGCVACERDLLQRQLAECLRPWQELAEDPSEYCAGSNADHFQRVCECDALKSLAASTIAAVRGISEGKDAN